MKSIVALTAALFAATAFAQAPAKKEEVKPAAPAASASSKDAKATAAPAKVEEKKDAAKK